MDRTGFTLIEMLAVIALLSLVAAVVGTSLVQADASAQWSQAVAVVRDLDLQGRLHARTAGVGVVLELGDDSGWLQLRSVDSDELLARRSVALDILLELKPEPAVETILFDRCGRSVDYVVAVTASGLRKRFHVNGLTGWVAELGEDQ